MSNKPLLVICGPTATGKTDLAFYLARELNGELVSADSRQVYIGMDIVTGRDIPANFYHEKQYFTDGTIRLWLTDIVHPNEPFSVSLWNDLAVSAIANIHSRGKLPIVVGVTSLYLRSLLENLETIHISPNAMLRAKLADKSPKYLFNYLNKIDSFKAASLNESDRHNPRRLLRAIEVSLSGLTTNLQPTSYKPLLIGLTLPTTIAYPRIDARVQTRIAAGAEAEVRNLRDLGYSWELPSMATGGYLVWKDYLEGSTPLATVAQKWAFAEHHDFRHHLSSAKKLSHVHWLQADSPRLKNEAKDLVHEWYNKSDAT